MRAKRHDDVPNGLVKISGVAAPIIIANIDTDQIIPSSQLVRARTEGYAASLFRNWRYSSDGAQKLDFILNRPPWDNSVILLTDRNFGSGSSREAAAKALREFGVRAIIAPSFGGIFYNNAFRNGVLPVELAIEQVLELAQEVGESNGSAAITVDLENRVVTSQGGLAFAFKTPELLRRMLMLGLDDISMTLGLADEIEAFRAQDRVERPWAY